MNKLFCLLSLCMVFSCNFQPKATNTVSHSLSRSALATANDTALQLEEFLDSIGHLPQQALINTADKEPDSIFRAQKSLDTIISARDFETLKRVARKGVMRVDTAIRIFKNRDISYDCTTKSIFLTYKEGLIPVVYTAFNKRNNGFDEFALCIGDPGHCGSAALYFFKGKRIIALHDGYDRFANPLAYYKDSDGKTVVYYGKNFTEGSGIDWNNDYFYKYDDGKLIPILDELEIGQVQPPASRTRWLESTIQSTHPLTLKMVYYQYFNRTISLPDTTYFESSPDFIKDSTTVIYQWDEDSKTLKGNYAHSKLNKAQIMSYYLSDNDYLFLNAHYPLLKRMLKDDKQRTWVFWYLAKVKAEKRDRN